MKTSPIPSNTPKAKSSRGGVTDDMIHEQIRAAIVERRIPAGTKLPENILAEAFGAGRGHIRKVLARLAHEHMVTHYPNRGAFVSMPTPKEAREVLAARRVVEEAIMRKAMERLTETSLARLRRHVGAEARAARDGDRIGSVRLSGEFHLAIAEIADNGPLMNFLADLIARSSLIVSVYENLDRTDCSHEEHATVLDLMQARDVEKSTAAMLRHLDEIESRLNLLRAGESDVDLKAIFSK